MNEEIKKNIILTVKTGSHLYGLNTEKSDVDLCGIFMEPTGQLFPSLVTIFSPFRENIIDTVVDASVKVKGEDGKNLKESVDEVYYSLHNFIRLATDCNPNIIEMLFVDERNIVNINEFGRKLIDNRHLFISKRFIDRFIGYAVSQEKKMYIKTENYNAFNNFINIFEENLDGKPYQGDETLTTSRILLESKKCGKFKQKQHEAGQFDTMYTIGSIELGSNNTIKNALRCVKKKLGKANSYRKGYILNKGYDYKFASHVIRLLIEGIELLNTKDLVFPLQRKDYIMDVKMGEVSLEVVKERITTLKGEIEMLKQNNDIPEEPRIKEIEELVFDMQIDFHDLGV